MAKFCGSCGAKLGGGALRYCEHCGAALATEDAAGVSPPESGDDPLTKAALAAGLFGGDEPDIWPFQDGSWDLLDRPLREAESLSEGDPSILINPRFAAARRVHASLSPRHAMVRRLLEFGVDREKLDVMFRALWRQAALDHIAETRWGQPLAGALLSVSVREANERASDVITEFFDVRSLPVRQALATLGANPVNNASSLFAGEPCALVLPSSAVPDTFEVVNEAQQPDSFERVFAKRVVFGKSPMIWSSCFLFNSEADAYEALDKLIAGHRAITDQHGISRGHPLEIALGDLSSAGEIKVDGKEGIWAAVLDRNVVHKVSTMGIAGDAANQLVRFQVEQWRTTPEVDQRRAARRAVDLAWSSLRFTEEYPLRFEDKFDEKLGHVARADDAVQSLDAWKRWSDGERFDGSHGLLFDRWQETRRLMNHYLESVLAARLLRRKGLSDERITAVRAFSGTLTGMIDRMSPEHDPNKPPFFAREPIRAQVARYESTLAALIDGNWTSLVEVAARKGIQVN